MLKMFKVLRHLIYNKRLRELCLLSLDKRRLKWDLISGYEYLKVGSKEDGDRLFSVTFSDKMLWCNAAGS